MLNEIQTAYAKIVVQIGYGYKEGELDRAYESAFAQSLEAYFFRL